MYIFEQYGTIYKTRIRELNCKRKRLQSKPFIYQKLSNLSVFRLIMLSIDVPKTSRDHLHVVDFIFSNKTFKKESNISLQCESSFSKHSPFFLRVKV